MKILFLQHGFGYGGATKSLQVMQKGLFEKVEIHTITKKNKRLNKILQKEFIHSNGIIEIDIGGKRKVFVKSPASLFIVKSQASSLKQFFTGFVYQIHQATGFGH
jgi:hypothetical protein